MSADFERARASWRSCWRSAFSVSSRPAPPARGRSVPRAEERRRPTRWCIANAVKVDTLDPAQNSVNESIWLDQNIWARLLQPNATGTGLIPDLATKWTVSKDGLTYRFTPAGGEVLGRLADHRRGRRATRSCAR